MKEPDFFLDVSALTLRSWLAQADSAEEFNNDLVAVIDEAQAKVFNTNPPETCTVLITVKGGG